MDEPTAPNWWAARQALYTICTECEAISCWKCARGRGPGVMCHNCYSPFPDPANQWKSLIRDVGEALPPPGSWVDAAKAVASLKGFNFLTPTYQHKMVISGLASLAPWASETHECHSTSRAEMGEQGLIMAALFGSRMAAEFLGEIMLSTSQVYSHSHLDWRLAAPYLSQAAYSGSTWAAGKIAAALEEDRQYQEAFTYWCMGCAAGVPFATAKVALRVYEGDVARRNLRVAKKLAERALKWDDDAAAGLGLYVLARLKLVDCHPSEVEEATALLKEGAELGDMSCIKALQEEFVNVFLHHVQATSYLNAKVDFGDMVDDANGLLMREDNQYFIAAKALVVAAAIYGNTAIAHTWLGIIYGGIQVDIPTDEWAEEFEEYPLLPPAKRRYTFEEEVQRDREKALQHLSAALSKGHAGALKLMTRLCREKDPDRSPLIHQPKHKDHDSDEAIMAKAVWLLNNGKGDKVEEHLFRKSRGKNGSLVALWHLALLYNGHGAFALCHPWRNKQSFVEARQEAARRGCRGALVSLAMDSIDEKLPDQATKYFNEANIIYSADGLADVADELATASPAAYTGFAQDAHLAIRLRSLATEKGSARAAFLLAELYAGEKVNDYTCNIFPSFGDAETELAESLYAKAAAQGHAKSQLALGIRLQSVDSKSPQAFKYFKLAAAQGESDAWYELGESHLYGEGTDRNIDEAIAAFKSGAEQGHGRCYWRLAMIHEYGLLTDDNRPQHVEAIGYLEKAIAANVGCLANVHRGQQALEKLENLQAELERKRNAARHSRIVARDWHLIHGVPFEDSEGPDEPRTDYRYVNLTSLCVIDRNATLRFNIGDRVIANVGEWKLAKVIRLWDDGNPYRLKVEEGGLNVWALEDTDFFVRAAPDLRFKVGDKVQALLSDWVDAEVIQTWGSDLGEVYPYELKVTEKCADQGALVWAVKDTDEYVKTRRRKGKR